MTNDPAVSFIPSITVSGSILNVFWTETRNGNSEIYSKRSTDSGLNWGADTRLTNDSASSWFSASAVSGSNWHLVWSDNRDGNDETYYKRSTDGGASWGADVRLTFDSADSFRPSVSLSGTDVNVIWTDNRDGNYEIYYKRSTDEGISWGNDQRLTKAPGDSYNATISSSGSGLHVAWWDARDGNQEIYYKHNPQNIILHVSLLIEGFYNVQNNLMNMNDTVRAYLRSTVIPYTIVDSAVSVIDSHIYFGKLYIFKCFFRILLYCYINTETVLKRGVSPAVNGLQKGIQHYL